MNYNIKAKPTIYKGFRFRSKLEAQWAVFFDLIEVDWEYEPATFETEEGVVCPDFKLTCGVAYDEHGLDTVDFVSVFVEVKPISFTQSEWDIKNLLTKYSCLALQVCEEEKEPCSYLLLVGDPTDVCAFDLKTLCSRGRSLGGTYLPKGVVDDDRHENHYNGFRFSKGPQYEGQIALCDVGRSDFATEAIKARQYDFMGYLPN